MVYARTLPTKINSKNPTISVQTIVAPTGVPAIMEMIIPSSDDTTAKIAEHIITLLKFLNTLIADKAGKMINADTRSEPTRFIASTIITADITAISKL